MNHEKCKWKYIDEYYETECQHAFYFSEGGIEDNNFRFCPFCGGELAM